MAEVLHNHPSLDQPFSRFASKSQTHSGRSAHGRASLTHAMAEGTTSLLAPQQPFSRFANPTPPSPLPRTLPRIRPSPAHVIASRPHIPFRLEEGSSVSGHVEPTYSLQPHNHHPVDGLSPAQLQNLTSKLEAVVSKGPLTEAEPATVKVSRRKRRRELPELPLPPTPPPEQEDENLGVDGRPASAGVAVADSMTVTPARVYTSAPPLLTSSVSTDLERSFSTKSRRSPHEVYSNFRRVVESKLSLSNQTLTQDLSQGPTPPNRVLSIIESKRYRERLDDALLHSESLEESFLSDSSHSRQEALLKDEAHLVKLVKSVLSSPEERGYALSLRDSEADLFMDVVELALDHQAFIGAELNNSGRKLLVEMSKLSTNLDSSLFISGVDISSSRNCHGGTFGDIYRGTYCGEAVAMKRLRLFRDSDRGKVYHKFCKEALLWRELKCDFILPFLGIDAENFPRQLCMVSPWMEHGTVTQFLKKNLKAVNVDKLLYQIACGIKYLHDQKIVHGDIKGANILVDNRMRPLLADFGLTVFADVTKHNTTDQGGTVRYMAPELLSPTMFGLVYKRTFATDMYSYGCLCVELYTQEVPFWEIKNEVIVATKIVRGERPARPEGVYDAIGDALWGLIEQCWDQHPKARPTARLVTETLKEVLRRSATIPSREGSSNFLPLSAGGRKPQTDVLPAHKELSGSSSMGYASSSEDGGGGPGISISQVLVPTVSDVGEEGHLKSRTEPRHDEIAGNPLRSIRVHADPLRMYHDMRLLRRTSTVQLYSSRLKGTTSNVSVKKVKIGDQAADALQRLADEFQAMRYLQHPNIIYYIDVFQYHDDPVSPSLWIVTEHISSDMVPLSEVMSSPDNASKPVSKKEHFVAAISRAVVKAVGYLHRHGVVHRHVRCQNVYMSRTGGKARLKLGAMIQDGETVKLTCQPAPEVVAGGAAGIEADIWDLGIMALEILCPQLLQTETSFAILDVIAGNKQLAPSLQCLNYMGSMLKNDHRERPTAEQLSMNPFLKSRK